MPDGKGNEDGILIEFQQHGTSVKVTAVDPVSTVEVSIIGPASAGRMELARAAIKKLKFVLDRKGEGNGASEDDPSPPGGRPGIIV